MFNKQIIFVAVAFMLQSHRAQAEDSLGATSKTKSQAPVVAKKTATKLPAKTALNPKVSSGPAQHAGAQTPRESAPVGGQRGIASVSDSNQALEIRGQSRNLSMMLTLRNRKNEINFVKPRENYSNEIQNTSY